MKTVLVFIAALVATAHGASLGWRVVGGQDAREGDVPYLVNLRRFSSHICGGSIINSRWILTAAHCVRGEDISALTVAAGSIKISETADVYKVEKVFAHEQYNSVDNTNDIGLVKLSEDIRFSANVQQIRLNENYVEAGVELTFAGWGLASYPGNPADILQVIKLRSISNEVCATKQSPVNIVSSELCTLTRQGQGICKGDSGGPLVYNGRVVGVASWARPCALGYPDVFTRVMYFEDWINEKIMFN